MSKPLTKKLKLVHTHSRFNLILIKEHIPISEPARNLITKILVLDPTKRPTLDEILNHPFLNHSGGIQKELPLCTLACPPPANFIKFWIFLC